MTTLDSALLHDVTETVHVWRTADASRWSAHADGESVEEVPRFREPEAARRWLGGRGFASWVLGHYVASAQIVRERGAKPRLVDGEIDFSFSRSGALAVVAVASGARVGVDIERMDEHDRAGRVLSARVAAAPGRRERWAQQICELVAGHGPVAAWATLEAIVKVDGAGLDGLDALQVGGERANTPHGVAVGLCRGRYAGAVWALAVEDRGDVRNVVDFEAPW